jgi:hypothetical protein
MKYINRNVFYLKYGKAREALKLWKDYLASIGNRLNKYNLRLLSDMTGPAYVLVLEIAVSSFEELDPANSEIMKDPSWKDFYNQFIPLCDRSDRILYKIEFGE